MISVEELEKKEEESLKPYACFSKNEKRNINISKHPYRTQFQRDRDRIVHSKAFRRLEYKTQVFLTNKGDHIRTRLTHSLEVAQMSRTVAMQLGLNCDLVEAISLGHDLGHTPFGHAGEKELISLLKEDKIFTFKHNVQSVKIVDLLESKYEYNGLALTKPVREGILKHTELPEELPEYCQDLYVEKPFSITLEGQIVAIVDEIAQVTHDLDDYLRYNIIEFNKFIGFPIFNEVDIFLKKTYNFNFKNILNEANDDARRKDTSIRCLVDFLITKLIEGSEINLQGDKQIKPYYIDKVYISFENNIAEIFNNFHNDLNYYIKSDYRVKEMDAIEKNIINKLYRYLKDYPESLPDETKLKYKNCSGKDKTLVIVDYISGMTDRYAIEQYKNIYGLK